MTDRDILSFLTQEQREMIDTDEFSDKICIHVNHWTPKDCDANPSSLYVFGDNDVRQGRGGQAIIRGCKNAIGIPTKVYPDNNPHSFYFDSEYEITQKKIQKAIRNILSDSKGYDHIVFPADGFGTGLANLKKTAPKTLKYINDVINACFYIDYEKIQQDGLQASIVLPTTSKQ